MPRTPNVAPALSRTRPARACTTAPTTAAVPTTTSEAVVAWCGLWPSRYTRAGTGRRGTPHRPRAGGGAEEDARGGGGRGRARPKEARGGGQGEDAPPPAERAEAG